MQLGSHMCNSSVSVTFDGDFVHHERFCEIHANGLSFCYVIKILEVTLLQLHVVAIYTCMQTCFNRIGC